MTNSATLESGIGKWQCPDSKLILPASASREEWLRVRKGGIGGSDAASLIGASSYSDGTPYFVWLEKTDPDYCTESNSAMERGATMEPIVRQMFEDQQKMKTRRQGMHQSREFPNLLASVDALAEDGGGWEGKTANQWVTKEWDDSECPAYYAAQARHYLAVTGRDHWHVSALDIDAWKLWHWVIERDAEQLEYESTVKQEFWNTYVVPRVAPDMDLERITSEEIERRFPTVTHDVLNLDPLSEKAQTIRDKIILRRALALEVKEGKAEYDQLSLELKAMAEGHGEIQIDGKKAFTVLPPSSDAKGRVTNDAILAAYPDVDLDKCRVKSTTRSLSVSSTIFAPPKPKK